MPFTLLAAFVWLLGEVAAECPDLCLERTNAFPAAASRMSQCLPCCAQALPADGPDFLRAMKYIMRSRMQRNVGGPMYLHVQTCRSFCWC